MRSLRRSPAKLIDLLPQDQVFRFQRCSRLEARSQDTENQPEQIGHQDASLRRPLAASTPNRIFGTHKGTPAVPAGVGVTALFSAPTVRCLAVRSYLPALTQHLRKPGDRFWREAAVREMGVYGTTAPEYTCVSLRERTSAHFVRLRTPDLRLTFVLD